MGTSERLLSLDIFRGMTVFFMILVNTPGSWEYVYAPLLHAKWDGCTPTDLVFPFFLYIAGVSMAISFGKFAKEGMSSWRKKVWVRGMTIILIGLLLNWFPFYHKNIAELRLFGVLPRIGLALLLAGMIVSFISGRWLWIFTGALLCGYWILLLRGGDLTLEGNLVRKADLALVGEKHMYHGFGIAFDPEGLLSTLPAVCTVLIGFLCGNMIIQNLTMVEKIRGLVMTGFTLVTAGWLWSVAGFPLNKALWSSSYVLFTSGLAILMLALLMWIVDVKKRGSWAYIFKAFGQNPLASFILSMLVVKILLHIKTDETNLYTLIYERGFRPVFGDYPGSFMFALFFVLVVWLVAWWLDKRGIILKV